MHERLQKKELLMGCSGHCRRYLTTMHTHRKTANMEKISFYRGTRSRELQRNNTTSGSIFIMFPHSQRGNKVTHDSSEQNY